MITRNGYDEKKENAFNFRNIIYLLQSQLHPLRYALTSITLLEQVALLPREQMGGTAILNGDTYNGLQYITYNTALLLSVAADTRVSVLKGKAESEIIKCEHD